MCCGILVCSHKYIKYNNDNDDDDGDDNNNRCSSSSPCLLLLLTVTPSSGGVGSLAFFPSMMKFWWTRFSHWFFSPLRLSFCLFLPFPQFIISLWPPPTPTHVEVYNVKAQLLFAADLPDVVTSPGGLTGHALGYDFVLTCTNLLCDYWAVVCPSSASLMPCISLAATNQEHILLICGIICVTITWPHIRASQSCTKGTRQNVYFQTFSPGSLTGVCAWWGPPRSLWYKQSDKWNIQKGIASIQV